MKIRNGFVSNSSSSSFILFKAYLTPEQMKQIRNWDSFCLTDEYKEMLNKYNGDLYPHNTEYYEWNSEDERIAYHCEPFSEHDYAYYPEGWDVSEGPNTFDFSTDMDNFDMEQFLEVIGVDIDKCGLWITYSGSYRSCLGLNDAKTDLLNYASDRYFMDDYDEKYYYTSKLYKEKIYPILKEWYDKQPENEYKGWPPHPPVEPKKWICEDAGQALSEVEHEVRFLAVRERCYFLDRMSDGKFPNKETKVLSEVIDIIKKVKDNWKAVDDFEEPQVYTAPFDLERWNKKKEDDSQRVIAALEGEGIYDKKRNN